MGSVQRPLYAQLKADLLGAIAEGELIAGERLPSHHQLTSQYGVSYMTMRRAINELLAEGAVYSVPGKGVYVAAPKQQAESDPLLSFSEDMVRRGLRPASLVLAAQVISAPPPIAMALDIPVGAAVIWLERLRLANGEPMAVQQTYLPYDRCPSLLDHDLAQASLFDLLSQSNLRPASATGAISAALATPIEARLLGVTLPAALLVCEQRSCLADGSPIEWTRSVYRGDRYQMPQ